MADRSRVLILAAGPVEDRMAGPALRSWAFANVLSSHCDVTLLTPNEDPRQSPDFDVRSHHNDSRLVRSALLKHDVLVFQGYALAVLPGLEDTGKCLVVDIYDPFTLETLHINARHQMKERLRRHEGDLSVLRHQLALGDFFICGHERQRDFWLGMLNAEGRLNPATSDQDPTFRRLIGCVPFGVPAENPRHHRHVLKGVHPGIGSHDKVILWIGGIWDWFDPETLIRAMSLIAAERDDVKLVFVGVASPDPTVSRMYLHGRSVELTESLGLLNTSVFFIDWVPHEDVQDYLMEADVGTYAHCDHLEAHYSIRTRVFDYIWAGLPMAISAGDVMGDRVESAGVAVRFPPGDVEGCAAAFRRSLRDPGLRKQLGPNFDRLKAEMGWDAACEPLVTYCIAPYRAADQRFRKASDSPRALSPWWKLPGESVRYVMRHGVRGFATEVRRALRSRGWRL